MYNYEIYKKINVLCMCIMKSRYGKFMADEKYDVIHAHLFKINVFSYSLTI